MSNAVIWAVLQSKLSLPDQSGVTEATCIPNGDLELRSAHHSVNCVGATRQLASISRPAMRRRRLRRNGVRRVCLRLMLGGPTAHGWGVVRWCKERVRAPGLQHPASVLPVCELICTYAWGARMFGLVSCVGPVVMGIWALEGHCPPYVMHCTLVTIGARVLARC